MLIAAAAREWQRELRQGSELVRIGIETGGTDRVVGKQDPADRDDDGAAAAAATCRDKQRQRKRDTKKQRKNGAQRADGSKDARSAKMADQSRRRRPFPSIRASHLYAPRHLHPAGRTRYDAESGSRDEQGEHHVRFTVDASYERQGGYRRRGRTGALHLGAAAGSRGSEAGNVNENVDRLKLMRSPCPRLLTCSAACLPAFSPAVSLLPCLSRKYEGWLSPIDLRLLPIIAIRRQSQSHSELQPGSTLHRSALPPHLQPHLHQPDPRPSQIDMDQKDNANPIVYQSSASANQRRAPSSADAEWWRDHSIHSSAASIRPPSASTGTGAIASSSSSAGTAFGSGLASSFSRATRSTLDEDDEEDEDEEDDRQEGDVHDKDGDVAMSATQQPSASLKGDEIDSQEIYDLIRSITDPEHPLTLEQLAVVNASHISVSQGDLARNALPHVLLEFTPTIPHCSMATLIGLSLRVRLLRALPERFKVDIRVRPGTHQSENAVNKQLNDKERVAAALENSHLFNVVQGCLASAGRRGKSADELAAYLNTPPSADGAVDQDHVNIWKTVDEITTRMGIAV